MVVTEVMLEVQGSLVRLGMECQGTGHVVEAVAGDHLSNLG